MKTTITLITCFIASCFFNTLNAQAPFGNAGEHTAVPLGSSASPFGYYEYLPTDFSTATSNTYPLVLFYHGFGERGNGTTDLSDILLFGPPKLIQQGEDFEAIIISPQNTDANYSATDFLNLYNYLTTNYPIDLNRVYVTGLSSGGASTWRALQGHFDKIAAAVPVCGTDILNDPSVFLQQTPVWTLHSFDDTVIDVSDTISNVNDIANISNSVMTVYPYGSGNSAADGEYSMQFNTTTNTWIAAAGINEPVDNLSFTIYNNGGHDSWTRTYNNQDVWDWLFAQNLNTLSITVENTFFKLYPNPASNAFTIETRSDAQKQLDIYSTSGRKIYSHLFSNTLTVDTSRYSSGIYFAKIIGNNKREKVIKFIVK